ncbi:hypothetical protein K456DRAFT_501435 [Colletotrichum gloeosporioides 23]|nr:hypothetical protein K456DRAFT_501435 [Colletotrichum gloeosporioides 23]
MSVSHPGPERTASLYITHKEHTAANCNAQRNRKAQHPYHYRLITSLWSCVVQKTTDQLAYERDGNPIATPSPTWGVSCLVSKTSLPQLELPVAPKPWTGNRGRHLKALTASLLQQLLGLRRAVASRPRHRLPRLSVLLKPLEAPSLNPSTPPRPPPPPPSWARTPSGSGSVQPTTTENHHLSLPCSPRLQLHGTESVACLLLLLLLSASVIIITPLRLALRLRPADLQDLLPCIRAATTEIHSSRPVSSSAICCPTST